MASMKVSMDTFASFYSSEVSMDTFDLSNGILKVSMDTFASLFTHQKYPWILLVCQMVL